MMKYAVINNENIVVNSIIWDGESKWSPPAGHRIIKSEAGIGSQYDPATKKFSAPVNKE
jgi:hypothetical protein